MKVKTYKSGGHAANNGTVSVNSMTLEGPIETRGSVTDINHAVTVGYVDEVISNLSATDIRSGIVSASRLPGVTGDILIPPNSSTVTLSPSGVIAGNYSKVTVDSKGRVIQGLTLTESDIPNLSWNKITTGKPTTLDGYGITDGLSTNGDIITGNITLVDHPEEQEEISTVGYVDSKLLNDGISDIDTGVILLGSTSSSIDGFLKCNGGIVSIEMYPDLYDVILDTFNDGSVPNGSFALPNFSEPISGISYYIKT